MTDKEKLDKLVAEIKKLRKEVKDNIAELGNSESERIGLFKDLEIYDNILSLIDSMQEEPKFKLGDIVRRKSDGLEARVINIVDGTYIVECEDWNDSILEHQWELVEEQEPRYPSFEESQGECHLFQDIALNG